MTNLSVPRRHVRPFQYLASLPDESFNRLRTSLTTEPAPRTRAELYSRATDALPAEARNEAMPLVDSILALCVVRAAQAVAPERLAAELAAAQELPFDTEPLRALFVQRIISLISLDSLTEVAKAVDLVADNDKVFGAARVITDIRPVFVDDPTAPPTGAVVIHTLKIGFMTDVGPNAAYYVLDDADLRELRNALDRAIDKSTTIQTLLTHAGLASLQPFGPGE